MGNEVKRTLFSLLLLAFLAGCAGFIRGIESELVQPSENLSKAKIVERDFYGTKMRWLELPGLSILILLNNQIQTHESHWFGIEIPMIPYYWKFRNKFLFNEEGPFIISVDVIPREGGFSFEPESIILTIDGKNYGMKNVDLLWVTSQDDGHVDKEEKDLFVKGKGQFALKALNHVYSFKFYIDITPPSPKQDITLDLSNAFLHNELPKVPVLKFKKKTWSRFRS